MEVTPIVIVSSFKGGGSTSSFCNSSSLRCISLLTRAFSAAKAPVKVIRTPRCLCASDGLRTENGTPLTVMLSVGIGKPVEWSMAEITDFFILKNMPSQM
jgi:hypothetical protein